GIQYYRGLPAFLATDAQTFVERGRELLCAAPIRHVDFTLPGPDALDRLLTSEHLAGLDSIGFPHTGLDDAAVAAIAACPWLTGCYYLDLSDNRLGPAAFTALAASRHLRQLLVVHRRTHLDQDPAERYHPGEDKVIGFLNTDNALVTDPVSAQGQELEAAYG